MPTLICLGNFRLGKRLSTVSVECRLIPPAPRPALTRSASDGTQASDSLALRVSRKHGVSLMKLKDWLQIEHD